LKSKKKYDFFHFPYFLEGHRLQAAKKKKKLKALRPQRNQKQCLCSFLHLKFPQETFIFQPGVIFGADIRADTRQGQRVSASGCGCLIWLKLRADIRMRSDHL
jgi:hypothetical protein